MTERELTLFSALSDIGDDLILDSGAFLPALEGTVALDATRGGQDAAPVKKKKKRAPWFIPATLAACVAGVTAVGILVGVVGHSFGFFPFTEPDTTVEETTVDDVTDGPTEDTTDHATVHESTEDTMAEPPTEEPTEVETEEPRPEYSIEPNDYGKEFNILYSINTIDKGYYFENSAESPSYVLGEAAYQRIKQTEEYLGVEILPHNGGGYGEFTGALYSAVVAGSEEYQMGLTYSIGLTGLMTAGHILDLNQLDKLSLRAAYWDEDAMDGLAVKGKRYLGVNDFLLPHCLAVGFNKEIAADLGVDEQMYTLVEDKGWTLEKLAEYAAMYGSDNGDGTWNELDSYGLSLDAIMPVTGFVCASDIPLIQRNGEGDFYISPMEDNPERIAALDSFLYGLAKKQSTYVYSYYDRKPALTMSSGRVFMETTYLDYLMASKNSGVEVGYLPYPLFDRDQKEYRSLYTGGYVVVPSNVTNREMVGDVIETLTYRSDAMKDAYIETLLGAPASERPEDAAMLEMICGSITYDAGSFLVDTSTEMENIRSAISYHIAIEKFTYAEYYKKNQSRAKQRLNKFQDAVPD